MLNSLALLKDKDYQTILGVTKQKFDCMLEILEIRAKPEIGEAVNFRGVAEQNDKIHFGIPETKPQITEQTIRDRRKSQTFIP